MHTTILADTQAKHLADGAQPGWNDNQNGTNAPAPRAGGPSPSPPIPQPLAGDPQPATINPQPTFPRCPGETPRAFSAFMTWFQLGHARSLAAVADQLGETPGTVKNWSSKHGWAERLQDYQAGLLQEQARHHAAFHLQQAADWSRRTNEYREQEWDAAQKLLAAAQCYLDSFGDQAVEKMTLAQVSRALQISSSMARQALSGTQAPAAPSLAPLQDELITALKKAYGSPSIDIH